MVQQQQEEEDEEEKKKYPQQQLRLETAGPQGVLSQADVVEVRMVMVTMKMTAGIVFERTLDGQSWDMSLTAVSLPRRVPLPPPALLYSQP